MLSAIVVVCLVAVTSAGAWWLGRRRGRSTGRLAAAVARAIAIVGAGVVFFVLNATLGLLAILAVRAVTPQFVSVYLLNDVSLLVLSLFQGLVFRAWWSE